MKRKGKREKKKEEAKKRKSKKKQKRTIGEKQIRTTHDTTPTIEEPLSRTNSHDLPVRSRLQ